MSQSSRLSSLSTKPKAKLLSTNEFYNLSRRMKKIYFKGLFEKDQFSARVISKHVHTRTTTPRRMVNFFSPTYHDPVGDHLPNEIQYLLFFMGTNEDLERENAVVVETNSTQTGNNEENTSRLLLFGEGESSTTTANNLDKILVATNDENIQDNQVESTINKLKNSVGANISFNWNKAKVHFKRTNSKMQNSRIVKSMSRVLAKYEETFRLSSEVSSDSFRDENTFDGINNEPGSFNTTDSRTSYPKLIRRSQSAPVPLSNSLYFQHQYPISVSALIHDEGHENEGSAIDSNGQHSYYTALEYQKGKYQPPSSWDSSQRNRSLRIVLGVQSEEYNIGHLVMQ